MKKRLLKYLLPIVFTLGVSIFLNGCSLKNVKDTVDKVEATLQKVDEAIDSIDSAINNVNDALSNGNLITSTPVPTATSTPEPTATSTPKPTATSTPKPTATSTPKPTATSTPEPTKAAIDENGSYCSKDEVALYIHTYGKLPKNYISKKDAEAMGWTGGSLEKYAPGKCIGGSTFGNYEGLLPKKKGRTYTECDIDTLGKSSRGAKRIVFSNDGLIYYTDDHYTTFTLLYGTP